MNTEPALRPGNDPWLSCDRLVIGHRGRAILPPIDLQIRPGTVLAVLGRNGAGKSTFFKTLLGFLPAVKGHIRRSSPPPRLAYMAQAATLDSTVPVRARDVAAWGTLQGWGFMGLGRGRAMTETADRALSAANAAEIAGSFVRDLSEGQRAKVLLSRVLAARANVALLDEPTAAMDAVAEQRTFALLRRESQERGLAVVVITHLLALVQRFADQALYLDGDDGLALCAPPAEIFAHPTFRRQYGEIDGDNGGGQGGQSAGDGAGDSSGDNDGKRGG